jgi:hypothetical protein
VAAFNDSALGQAIAATIPSLTGALDGITANIESLQATVAQFRNDNRRP